MKKNTVKISSLIQNQVPSFVRDESPLLIEFLGEYYNYLESPGNPADILQNIDVYKNLDHLINSKKSATLAQDLDLFDFSITVDTTEGFPHSNGLIKIDDEIIYYKSKTETTFEECSRGFSGAISYTNSFKKDALQFENTFIEFHSSGSVVVNLYDILLQEFLTKAKAHFLPGFEGNELYSELNQSLFIKQSKDFYSSKGTDASFKVLFKALFGEEISVIRPKEFLFRPSASDYRVTLDLVVEAVDGEPYDCWNKTLYQDQDGEVPKAYGTINNIEDFIRDDSRYYRISLDYGYSRDIGVNGSVFGSFSIHPQTQLINTVSVGASVIDVDSTVSFSNEGELLFKFENEDLENEWLVVGYTSKTSNQFLGCSGVERTIPSKTFVSANQYVYSYDNEGNQVKMRVGGVLSELDVITDVPYSEPNDYVFIKTLGIDSDDVRTNSWIFNVPTSNRVFQVINEGNLNYNIITFDECNLNAGEFVELNFKVLNFDGSEEIIDKQFEVKVGSIPGKSFRIVNDRPILDAYYVRKRLTKLKGTEYNANVQNTYKDYVGSTYVTAHSLPNYFNENVSDEYRSVVLSGNFSGETITVNKHGFLTGEAVVYNSFSSNNNINLIKNVYYVHKVDINTFKLARSRTNLDKEIFITLEGTVEYAKLIPVSNVADDFSSIVVGPQKLIRKIESPKESITNDIINPNDKIGILQNGVEIQTYKTSDYVYYGEIQKVVVTSSGSNYDLFNPPEIFVSDPVGSGLSCYPTIKGFLSRIDVVDTGFDYLLPPQITITGGNASAPVVFPEMLNIQHSESFSASSGVSTANNTIDFKKSHRFRDGERVGYYSDGQASIGGIVSGSFYFVGILSKTLISLHATEDEAYSKINPINITSTSVGNHRIVSTNPKSIVSGVRIYDLGGSFSNNKIIVNSSGINTSSYTIKSIDHGFSTGEVVIYECSNSNIVGLATDKEYYVTSVDKDTIRLSEKLQSPNNPRELFLRKEYVKISSSPSGTHTFKYPPVKVNINGVLGVSTIFADECKCRLNAIFRGEITDVHISSSGNNYGSPDIINFSKQPHHRILSGEEALVKPVIYDGKIVDVIVLSGGKNYYSTPDLAIVDPTAPPLQKGSGAVLTPIISNGKLTDVIVIRSGFGYGNSTTIDVRSPASGASMEFNIKPWNINLVESLLLKEKITDDDLFIASPKDKRYGLQYTHVYAPRKLRNILYSEKLEEGVLKYQTDLQNDTRTPFHSPIIGWAYDGNPIYGPYGYDTPFGGRIRQMISGYEKVNSENRPNYPLGFFIEDFSYTGKGDLDKNNGRYCITPEFPKGTYAYFLTLDQSLQKEGQFALSKLPAFPYILGGSYNNKFISFNSNTGSNQDDYGINSTKWRRNIRPYNLNKQDSGYEYLLDPTRIQKDFSIVESVSRGRIDGVDLLSPGSNYKVGDPILFDNSLTGGVGASAKVAEIVGKEISRVENNLKYFNDVELTQSSINNGIIGFCTVPHTLQNRDNIRAIGFSTQSEAIIDTFEPITVKAGQITLTSNVPTSSVSGIITYFNVSGLLEFPYLAENDIFQINSEKIKVLRLDRSQSRDLRILVERQYDGTVGAAHSINDKLFEIPRKFYINNSQIRSNIKNITLNRELYFIPQESVGLGTIVGFGYTATITNPGIGLTQIVIPTKTIYLYEHGLETGDKVIYNSYNGSDIEVSINGITTSLQFASNEYGGALFVAKIDNNNIGLSTVKLGISTNSSFVGLTTDIGDDTLSYTGIGTGYKHSFKTLYDNVINSEIFHNEVTVYTNENSELSIGDEVSLILSSGEQTEIDIRYNDKHRRLVSNPKSFDISDVNLDENTIYIENHEFETGDKVIYVSDNNIALGGLLNDEIYFVVYKTKDTIQLSNSFYNSIIVDKNDSNIINLTSASSSGKLFKVNPLIKVVRNNKIRFLLSDPSLSFIDGTSRFPAFEFKLFKDDKFQEEYLSDGGDNAFQVSYNGVIGIDENAYADLIVTDKTPFVLYYNLVPLTNNKIPSIKREIFSDGLDVLAKNTLLIQLSDYSQRANVVSVGTTFFRMELPSIPEKPFYNSTTASIKYVTASKTAKGQIQQIFMESEGNNYERLVGVARVLSPTGKDAKIKPKSDSVGKDNKYKIQDIGFNYSSDLTLRPTAKLPDVLALNQRLSFDKITASTQGRGYVVPPDLVVKDSSTNEVLTDLILSNTESGVEIIKNTNNLSNNTPKFIPINNSNGYSIKNITFNFSTKIVTITFKTSFSSLDDFPFEVGDTILVEGCKTKTLGSFGRGFNSSEFDYNLFEIISRDPNIGGSNASITYSMSDYILSGETLGEYDLVTSSGIVVPEKYFPTFAATTKRNNFISGELVVGSTSNTVGTVLKWDSKNEILKVNTLGKYTLGEKITGSKSGAAADINEVATSEIVYKVEATSVVTRGWEDEVGFLNNSNQKVQDGDYYQNFSYSIRSRVPLEKWSDTVNSLNHLSGFKKFSDLVIESSDLNFTGISTQQDSGDFLSIAFISEVVDLDCVYDFDIAIDETDTIGTKLISNGMIFNSRDLQDYEESIGNRVLVIDDISELFNDRPRPNPYSVVTTFKLEEVRSRKFIVFARDKRFTSERQVYLVTFIHDGNQTYLNQYGRVETGPILGSFDFDIFGDEGRLLFYPIKYRVNNYDLSFVSYDVEDYISGVGNTSIGNIVDVRSTFTPLNAGITTTIASIPLDYRTSKLLVQIEDSSSIFEFDEITVIHDGTNVEIIDYGQITTDSFDSESVSGIGTYNAYINGDNLLIDLIPNILLDADVNVLRVSIASSESGYVTEGSVTLNTSKLKSEYVGISTTSSTSPTKIAEFESGFYDYNGGYLIVSIEDTTNNRYQVSECVVASDETLAYNSEFGVLTTNGEIGIITSFLNGSTTELYFTADSAIDCQVRVYLNTIGLVDTFNLNNEIDLDNARISTGYGEYEGTESAIRKSFELFHKGNPIFQKKFNGESSSDVDVANNLVQLPQHFFVTGEKVKYSYEIFNQPIGIATTSIPGIGVTDKLPEDLYIVKETDLYVKFASTAQNALKLVPDVLTITSVGFGSEHYITAEKQNAKALITVDNMIQSPIVSTATTSTLSASILTTDDIIDLSNNIEFFKSGDLIKINDELMRVSIVGYGTTSSQIYVDRPWLGSVLQNHSVGDVITKVVGNYNIVDNVLNFADAPYGKYPLGSPENRPDSRDWTGITTHSTFSGRTFMRSGITDGSSEPYEKNYVFDGIQDQFNGITTAFSLKVNGQNVTGIEQSNAIITVKDIFQSPRRTGVVTVTGNYYLQEDEIEDSTTIYFEGNTYSSNDLDISITGLPVSGKITSVGSNGGFGYQTLVAAAGTAVVSASGTIQSIIVTNVGSGYRSGIQTVRVGVRTSTNYSEGYNSIGIASVSYGRIVSVAVTNPGTGYTSSNPPEVVFDDPLSYSNLDLEYSTTSIGKTTGQNAKVNVVVGQGSSVIDFEIIDPGFGYEINNVLTVSVGGTTGIPREYRGRLIDGANLLSVNKEYIKNEVVGFITNTYPGILTSTDYDENICKRDVGYIVDAISKDLAFGGNYYSVQAGFAYYIGTGGTTYVDGEKTETIAGYNYITNMSQYIINNITVPVSYQSGVSSVSQIKDLSIDFDESCNPSAYSENCCSDVWYTIGNYVGIITTIIGFGTAYAPTIQSPYSKPTLSLPTALDFNEFNVSITDTDTDEFTAWTIGDIAVLDDISPLFNGFRTRFPIKIDGIQKSIKSKTGSLIDVQSTLLVFINDILQVPGIGYIFKGGSIIRFPEAPKPGNTAKILFYRGTGSIDVRDVDILESVKPGDRLRLHSDILQENQSDRSVKDITSTDSVETFPYGGEGIIQDPFLERPVNWCKQKNDIIVDGQVISKARDLYEAQINPFTNIISDISIGSTFVYVESLKTFFDDQRENAPASYTNIVDIVTQDETEASYAVASVNAGIVTQISLQNKGKGYTTAPTVSIYSPLPGISTASATAVIVNGEVNNITIDNGGSGYDNDNPPLVLISPPLPKSEVAYQVEYSGDFGFISGIGTTTIGSGIGTTALVFELFIPENSSLLDPSVVEDIYDQSTIQVGDYFVIKSTNIGFGITSLDVGGDLLVSGNEYIDNVYQVAAIDLEPYEVNTSEIISGTARYASFAIGTGSSVTVLDDSTLIIVDRIKVVTPIEDLNGLVINEFLSREFFGEYTWGKISNLIRPNPEEYFIYRDNGLAGISTSPIARRTNALKYVNYLS